MTSRGARQVLWLGPCLLLLALVHAAPLGQTVHYTCPPVAQPAGGCDASCQRITGNTLLRLYAALIGSQTAPPWHKQTAYSLCTAHCHAVPPYCGWPGVVCCNSRNDSRVHQHKHCRLTGVEHDMCPASSAAGAVWKLDLTLHNLTGTLSDAVIEDVKILTGFGLHAVDLSSNRLSGTLPDRLHELGANFTTLNLNFNQLTGTIPRSIKRLKSLKRLYLSFNKFHGSLDGRFCQEQDSPMEVLILRSNYFNGTADLRACSNLLLLDVTDNQLNGSLPVGIENEKIISIRATNNKFSGSISDEVWRLPLLTTIDIGNNDLSGTLSKYCGTSNNLVNIYLGNNSLSGTIPPSIAANSQLLVLDLQNNTNLHGTFPTGGVMVGLRRLDIHNTSISGTIPLEWGQLPYLEFVDISGTRMTCCQTQEEADSDSFPKLPYFLTFSKSFSQFDLNSTGGRLVGDTDDQVTGQPNNILCRTVVRKPLPDADWNKLQLPITANTVNTSRWSVSPLYYWFHECTCTKFFDIDNSTRYLYGGTRTWCADDDHRNFTVNTCLNMSIFTCRPLDRGHPGLTPGAKGAVIVAVLATILVICSLVYLMLAKANKFKRQLKISAVRLKGPPRSGKMTLVVTDIEGYSDIFRRSPEVMFKALVLHNSVLRAAKYRNGGFVLEQEGDSFTICFYNPFDAVVFCLEAQQALLAVQWPAGLEQEQEGVSQADLMASRKGSKSIQSRLSPLLGLAPKLKRVSTNTSARSMVSTGDYNPSFFHTSIHGFGSKNPLEEPVLFNGLRVRMGVVTGEVPSGTSIKNSALFQLAKVVGDFGNGGQIILDEATFAAIKDDAQALGAVDAAGLNHSKLSSGRSAWNWLLRLFGLVRPHIPAEEVVLLDMGAFCQAPPDDDAELQYTTSRVLDIQKPGAENQAASGKGRSWRRLLQPCSPCCSSSADLEGSGDLSDSSPRSPLPPAAQMSRPYLGSRASTGRSRATASTGTRPASLGPFGTGPISKALGSFTPSSSLSFQQQRLRAADQRDGADVGQAQDTAGLSLFTSFTARATKQWAELRRTLTRSQSFQRTQSSRRDWESVRLYQVLAPPLAGRAHVWLNKLNLKDGWLCWDNMFFEAPGSTYAPLTGGNLDVLSSGNSAGQLSPGTLPLSSPTGIASDGAAPTTTAAVPSSNSSPQLQPTPASNSADLMSLPVTAGAVLSSASLYRPAMPALPPVTMVFMAVEGPEQLVRRRRPFTPVVQSLLSKVVRDALRRLGGYLCRVQEGDMKFMVCFASPVTALEWCLLVQVAAMYLPWPQSSIMLLPSCRERVDSTGRLVFRGPCIKMGVSEGVPRSIIPDHEGRADYHGQSINMAARFMDKGARGGQIACTRELAERAMAAWAAGNSNASFTSLGGLQLVNDSIAEDDHVAAAPPAADVTRRPSSADGLQSLSNGYLLAPLDMDMPGQAGLSSYSSSKSQGNLAQQRAERKQKLNSFSSDGGKSRTWRDIHSHPLAAPASTTHAAPPWHDPPAGVSAAASCSAHDTPFAGLPGQQATTLTLLGSSSSGAGSGAEGAAAGASVVVEGVEAPMQFEDGTSHLGTAGSCPARTLMSADSSVQLGIALATMDPAALRDHEVGQPQPRIRATGGSWPGAMTAEQQQQLHLQRQQGRQTPPSRFAKLWRYHSRSRTSADGSSHGRRMPSACLSNLSEAQELQGQALGATSTVASPTRQSGVPPAMAPSPFVIQDVPRVPFKVEVHRLGLYSFKGGPPQQEMVQVVPSHLLGRLEFLAADHAPAASRKGQLLQPLEGRVGEPVTVPLPGLAQEYYERLPTRVTGITGLPHLCSSTATPAARQQGLPDALSTQLRGGAVAGQRGSRSMTLPPREVLHRGVVAHAGSGSAAGAAAASNWGPPPVMRHVSDMQAARGLAAAGTAAAAGPSCVTWAQQQQLQRELSLGTPVDTCSGTVTQQVGATAHTGSASAAGAPQPSGQLQAGGPEHKVQQPKQAGEATSVESCVVEMQGLGLRHDSFKSVDDEAAAVGSDEESGLAAPGATAGAAGPRSKSDPVLGHTTAGWRGSS